MTKLLRNIMRILCYEIVIMKCNDTVILWERYNVILRQSYYEILWECCVMR